VISFFNLFGGYSDIVKGSTARIRCLISGADARGSSLSNHHRSVASRETLHTTPLKVPEKGNVHWGHFV
jgi:hypothetical protein